MTATYDGRLVVTDKTVEPCCAVMHTPVSLGPYVPASRRSRRSRGSSSPRGSSSSGIAPTAVRR